MTTELDKGCEGETGPMLSCHLNGTHTYSSLILALRDMRSANDRDPATDAGDGNDSWIGLVLGMIVLDNLSGTGGEVGSRFKGLLTDHGVSEDDARYIYRFRCSLHHEYGLPRPTTVDDRRLVVIPGIDAYAVDTSRPDRITISVPAFCGRLVERIAYEAPKPASSSLINTRLVLD
ncbi:hypothetical protein BS329_17900 [Amycolatopsis coloradensis]|uniref:Uncharacterized protein n=1 Tax=Amycolatopsis coloradensis TaxID=76021 RepID=A0A1R0KT30_9PSEU|nr:hypothetical protein [Amycolatopsis coloradensis]OLZ51115.1 hypothetical protein BS329_17900 [Amycolatopsis coloradensis]